MDLRKIAGEDNPAAARTAEDKAAWRRALLRRERSKLEVLEAQQRVGLQLVAAVLEARAVRAPGERPDRYTANG
mgnify:CR=1 FL=1